LCVSFDLCSPPPSFSIILCTPAFHLFFIFFFNYTATTEIYTLSLHDALPIYGGYSSSSGSSSGLGGIAILALGGWLAWEAWKLGSAVVMTAWQWIVGATQWAWGLFSWIPFMSPQLLVGLIFGFFFIVLILGALDD